MSMYRLPKEFELTDYGESYAADLVEGKLTAYELTIKHRMGLIEPDGSFGTLAKIIMFLYKNDYEELYNSIDLESAEAVRALDGNLNALINLGLGKGDWWSGEDYFEDRVGPGKGQRMDTRRSGYVPGVIRYIHENR